MRENFWMLYLCSSGSGLGIRESVWSFSWGRLECFQFQSAWNSLSCNSWRSSPEQRRNGFVLSPPPRLPWIRPFFSALFDNSQEAEGKERLALLSAFPWSIWSTAWGMWTLLLNADKGFSHAHSVSSANNLHHVPEDMGFGEMCILVLSTAKGHWFFCGAVSGDAARHPAELPPGCLSWRKIWALYLSSFLFWSGFPEQKGRWLPSCHQVIHGFQKLYHHSTFTCLVEYQIGSSQQFSLFAI